MSPSMSQGALKARDIEMSGGFRAGARGQGMADDPCGHLDL
jgi:hypothetical protein